MSGLNHYVIRGGTAGRERLRFIAQVLQPGTDALLNHAGIESGARCLDVGCGGGDMTTVLARRVGPSGRVIGIDLDAEKLDLATREAAELGLQNVTFQLADLRDWQPPDLFDVIYIRFVLTHLPDPAAAAQTLFRWLRPGGLVIVEDIDYHGCFTWPERDAFRRYCEMYCEVVRRRGGDAYIGRRLPQLLMNAGFEDVGVSLNQPVSLGVDAKRIHVLTLENIADALIQSSVASRDEVQHLLQELETMAADRTVVAAIPRIVQTWGRVPASPARHGG
jgi:SAM-dependent methyltransferase